MKSQREFKKQITGLLQLFRILLKCSACYIYIYIIAISYISSLIVIQIIKIKNGDKVLCEAISSDPDQRVFLIRGCPQYKYSLTSGKYLAIPVTHQSQCEMEFCFRVYSNSKIRARLVMLLLL